MIKNRNKNKPSFANINFIGKCNAKCFFCIGSEAHHKESKYFEKHFKDFPNLDTFLRECKKDGINKLYFTGLDSEPSLYPYLKEFTEYLKNEGFIVGIRTNGVKMLDYSIFNGEVSISIHSFNKISNILIGMPNVNFEELKSRLSNIKHRYAIVVNRFNEENILETLTQLSSDKNIDYIQLRQICTDEMDEKYLEDHLSFDRVAKYMENHYSCIKEFDGCKIYDFNGTEICVWMPMSNETNSYNYFIDGRFAKSYFVLETYNNTTANKK